MPELQDITQIIGQAFGLAAVVFGFISFQKKTPGGIIVWQLATAVAFSLNYLLIGAMTGMALNAIAAVKGVLYYIRDKKGSKSLLIPIIFCLVAILTTVLTWESWYSVFILIGVLINAIAFAVFPPQTTRYCMLVKAPVTLLYNVFVFSLGGIIYESSVFISSVIGIIRFRKSKGCEKTCEKSDGSQNAVGKSSLSNDA